MQVSRWNMEKPSWNQLIIFLKKSKPHKDILKALPLISSKDNDRYTNNNQSVFYKQYALLDLERWGLIELVMKFDSAISRQLIWKITRDGELMLEGINYDPT